MRVIAGKARRMTLVTPAGLHTRPTSDKIKETLFNILQPDIPDAMILDLFSGSGGIGIEALSRGAKKAVFVDNSREAVKCIRENLRHTKLESQAEVIPMDVLRAVNRIEVSGQQFDIIFMDPPYNKDLELSVLQYLQHAKFCTEDTLIIVEASLETDVSRLEGEGFTVLRQKQYKTNQHIFLQKENK